MEAPKKPTIPPKSPSNMNFSATQKHQKPMSASKVPVSPTSGILGSERVPEKTVKAKSTKILLIATVAILLALIIGITTVMLIITPQSRRMNDISINFIAGSEFEPISISAGGGEGEERQYVMPGDSVKCTFNIESKKDPNFTDDVNLDVFLRFKVYFETDDNYFSTITLNFIDGDTWIKGVDGYYYYTKGANSKGVLSPGDKIEITKSFYIDTSIGNEYAGKKVAVNFDAQVLQANYQAINELWPTAPYSWSSQYRDLV